MDSEEGEEDIWVGGMQGVLKEVAILRKIAITSKPQMIV